MGLPDPVYQDDLTVLYQGDALALLPEIPSTSIQLILVDPPYMGVKTSYLGKKVLWDRQWKTRADYLDWLRQLATEWQRILLPNGSLYCFASPEMAAHIEVLLGDFFQVLNNIRWVKDDGWHQKSEKDSLRSYLSPWEAILFCEQEHDDIEALGQSGYERADQLLKIKIFGQLISEALEGTHTTAKQVTEAIGAYGHVNHGGAVSNWLSGYNIASKQQYEAMRMFFRQQCGHDKYLRAEYETLRTEYETLRRPFTVSPKVPYTDVWDFATVPAGAAKHPCEKPLPLLRHIIEVSSRPGDLVLDCFAGSCSTLEAAKQTSRRSIGMEMDGKYCRSGHIRLSQGLLF